MANPAGRAAPWVDLPRELTANILQRLRVVDIFQSAQVRRVKDGTGIKFAETAKQLRHLRVSSSKVSDEGFSKTVKEFPVLEELQLEFSAVSKQGIEAVGQSCPFLNSFSFTKKLSKFMYVPSDEEAVAIAENMHGLKHLTLNLNQLTDKGVEAILDACPRLQSLNVDRCGFVRLAGELGKRYSQQINNKDKNHIHNLDAYMINLYLSFL
nr:F-box protein SKIP19-like [Ipomoea batatas]